MIAEKTTEKAAPDASPSAAIITENLTKTYRTGFWQNQQVNSLKACSLEVKVGETFGLLGANGAGKTTLLKLLLGIVQPTDGSAKILGQDLGNRLSRQKIGYLPESAYYYEYLTGWEFLDFVGNIFEISPRLKTNRIAELLDLVGLPQSTARKKQIRTYSKGMVQRIGLAQALINDPELVFLDEPMSGLDPVGRYQIREIILTLKNQGKTVFFNSHILSDVELICDRIGILHKGELIAIGTLGELLGTESSFQVSGHGGEPAQLASWISNLEFQNNTWHGTLIKDTKAFIEFLTEINATLIGINMTRQSLEDFFIAQVNARQF